MTRSCAFQAHMIQNVFLVFPLGRFMYSTVTFIHANATATNILFSFSISHGLLKVVCTPGFHHPNCVAETRWVQCLQKGQSVCHLGGRGPGGLFGSQRLEVRRAPKTFSRELSGHVYTLNLRR